MLPQKKAFLSALAAVSLLLVTALWAPATCSQSKGQSLPGGYALRITYPGNIDTFTPMYGSGPKWSGSFTTSPLILDKPAATDGERVSNMEISITLEGDRWKLTVSVTFGEFYDKGKKQIAVYQVREGEKANLKELTQYGLKPFDVSIVKVESAPAFQPEVVNQTNSIAVLNVKTRVLPLPYHIVLKNMSDKAVLALEITTHKRDRRLYLIWPSGSWDRPLIEAGHEYAVDMTSEGEFGGLSPDDYLPDQSQRIEINTVVFTDGTYEGKPFLAGVQMAGMVGNRLQLDRVLPLIESALNSGGVDSEISQFKEALSSVDEIVEPASFVELKSQFPSLSEAEKNNLLIFARAGLHRVKSDLTEDLTEFERTAGRTANNSFKAWLEGEKKRYERWRSSLP